MKRIIKEWESLSNILLTFEFEKGKATGTETFGLECRHKVIYRPFSRCYGGVLVKEEAR